MLLLESPEQYEFTQWREEPGRKCEVLFDRKAVIYLKCCLRRRRGCLPLVTTLIILLDELSPSFLSFLIAPNFNMFIIVVEENRSQLIKNADYPDILLEAKAIWRQVTHWNDSCWCW